MTCSGGTDTSVKNASTTPKSYTLDELQQEIAKDKDWRTAFRYVPRVSKTNLKFHRMPQILAKPCLLPERLLIGGSYKLGSKGKRVYAEVFRSPGGAFNLVDIRHCNDTKTALHRSLKDEEVKMLQSVVYVEPFNLLEKAGSTGWRKCVRFLLLYYFLEQHTLTKLVFTSDGLEALKRAFTSIAAQSQRITKPPLRLRWKGPKPGLDQEAKPEKTESRISSCARDENIGKSIIMKQESLSKFTPVKAPENDSTRAVSTMILEDDKVASLLLPELGRSSEDSLKNEDSKTHAMAIPEHTITTSSAPEPQLKRKRSTDDTSENANTELIVSYTTHSLSG